MHFWLVLACHSYCLAYFPHAYRVFYFVLVIIIDVTYSLSELLGMCYHVYSLTPPKCVVVCTLYLLYSKVSVCAISTTAWGGGGAAGCMGFYSTVWLIITATGGEHT
jgi:hypothetical protein